jgi:NADPH-dependent 2,4-dienoyl-CoA reductase/sulfur reductase-like enzyme
MKLVIIGGSDAGISAALRAREIDSGAEVQLVVADAYPNFSICGLPFFLSGEIADWRTLAHRTIPEIEHAGIILHLNCTAYAINSDAKSVLARNRSGNHISLSYDKLVICTGAVPVRPPIEGLDLPGVFVLHTMEESFAFDAYRESAQPRSAVIIGGGYIGLEMADALRHRGIVVTLIETLPTVMKTVDPEFGKRVVEILSFHGVDVRTNAKVRSIRPDGASLRVEGDGFEAKGEIVLVVAGVRPLSDLAPGAGVATDARGTIVVDDRMRTNVPDIFAAGDCVQTWHRILRTFTYMPLGTTSHKQGRVAGANAAGGEASFAGSIGTQSVKLFDKVIAATGLREAEAAEAGFAPLATEFTANDHKAYYPNAKPMQLRVIGDRTSHRLLGAQITGAWGTEVSKRVDIFATAIFNGMTVDALNDLDLSYTPPLSSPWDPVQMAAQAWLTAAAN